MAACVEEVRVTAAAAAAEDYPFSEDNADENDDSFANINSNSDSSRAMRSGDNPSIEVGVGGDTSFSLMDNSLSLLDASGQLNNNSKNGTKNDMRDWLDRTRNKSGASCTELHTSSRGV